ncbi:MAG: CBS domain-containing protein, partial [Gemmatimonadaceae bacterium]
ALLEARGFTPEDFAMSHPGGSLGRKLLLKIRDLMHTGERVPRVAPDASLSTALLEMTRKGLGMAVIVDPKNHVAGIFTDGDLRRALDRELNVHRARIADVMTRNCTTVRGEVLAGEAIRIMNDKRITALPVVDADNNLIGALHMHDLVRAGVV